VNPIPGAQRRERRVLAREGNQRDLHPITAGQVIDRQAHAVDGDRAVRNRDLAHGVRHAQVVHPRVATLFSSLHYGDAIHVSLDEVTP